MRRTRVKFCGVTSADDAYACEAAGADAVGLIFAPASKRRLTPATAAPVAAALGPFVQRVGVFVQPSDGEVQAAIAACKLDVVQLHGEVDDRLVRMWRRRVRVVRALRFTPGSTPKEWSGRPHDGLLLDGPEPGSGRSFAWSEAEAWRATPNLILAGGLRPENVAAAIEQMQPYAVDVASGIEERPGVKDPVRLRAFIDAVRAADAA